MKISKKKKKITDTGVSKLVIKIFFIATISRLLLIFSLLIFNKKKKQRGSKMAFP